jgi:NAD(P)-dependent dehydrogenase (short-subunit alcohol dehydrogenase family)
MNLKGKVAIITGGGTGIGFGIAEVLAEKGVKLVLAQPVLEVAQIAASKLKDKDVYPAMVDLRMTDTIESMVNATISHYGHIDILVNNAGLTGRPALCPFLDSTPAIVDSLIDTNLKGTFNCSQMVASSMVAARRPGNIVHIASVGAFTAQEFASLYCATKAALVSLAKSMALELAPFGIRVNCVAPGDIHTEASATITEDKGQIGASSKYIRATPIGHRGCPQDIGHAVAYLVSDESSFVTGTTLIVDGGFLSY